MQMGLGRLALLSVGVAVLAACVDARSRPMTEPEFYARNTKAYAETAKGLPPEVVYGWNLTVAGEAARWRECTAPDACSQVERTRPKAELVGIERVADVEVEGRPVEVFRLSLAARPSYVVPNFKPAR